MRASYEVSVVSSKSDLRSAGVIAEPVVIIGPSYNGTPLCVVMVIPSLHVILTLCSLLMPYGNIELGQLMAPSHYYNILYMP